MATTQATPTRMHDTVPTASLDACFSAPNGQSQLTHCYATAPLKIAKTFPQGNAIGVCVMDVSPGLLAGDHYDLRWRLEPGAHVMATTQGFTRVHPGASRLDQRLHIAAGAILDYDPQPLMLYRGASLHSRCHVEIEQGGTLLLSEIVCAGRIERGEVFDFDSWRSRLRIRYDGELIYVNNTGIQPAAHKPRGLGAWGGYTHLANFFIFGPDVGAALRDSLREAMPDAVWGGVSLLEKNGLVVTMMGHRAWDLQEAVRGLREQYVNSYIVEQ